jgi:endonuclease/exonuclease/phosphatase family metal-dependent hydrolase
MKLVQLNAWGGRLEPQIRDFLQDEKPDIVCLQEAISFGNDGSGLFITTEQIQQIANLPHEAFAPVFSFSYMKGLAKFGNGIFTNHPILKSDVVFTHMEHIEDFMWGEHSPNMRNFVHAEIEVGESTCHVLTHHGYWISHHKNGTEDTEEQIKILADYISKLEGPVILTGDFNLVPESKSMAILNKQLKNLPLKYKLPTTRTSLTFKTEVCDYIFINETVKLKKFSCADKVVSDHMALVLEFEI